MKKQIYICALSTFLSFILTYNTHIQYSHTYTYTTHYFLLIMNLIVSFVPYFKLNFIQFTYFRKVCSNNFKAFIHILISITIFIFLTIFSTLIRFHRKNELTVILFQVTMFRIGNSNDVQNLFTLFCEL